MRTAGVINARDETGLFKVSVDSSSVIPLHTGAGHCGPAFVFPLTRGRCVPVLQHAPGALRHRS